MKKTFLTKALSLTLCAAMLVPSVPTFAVTSDKTTDTNSTTTTIESVVDTETDSVNANITDKFATNEEDTGLDITFPEDAPDLDTLNVFTDSVETIDDFIFSNNETTTAAWVSSLSEAEIAQIKSMDTMLTKTYDIYSDVCETCGLTNGTHFETALEYFQKVAECKHQVKDAASYGAGTGYCNINFGACGSSVIYCSGFTSGQTVSKQQTSLSWSVSGAVCGLSISTAASKTLVDGATSSTTYNVVWCYINFTKPANYALTDVDYSQGGSGRGQFTATANQSGNNLTYGSNLSTSDFGNRTSGVAQTYGGYIIINPATGMVNAHRTYKFNFQRITYSVVYHTDGATEGSQTTKTYTYGANEMTPTAGTLGIAKKVNIYYDNTLYETLNVTFSGWVNATSNATWGWTPGSGSEYTDHCYNGGWYNLYPVWGTATTTVKQATNKTGYTFNGWQLQGGSVYQGGQSFTTASNQAFFSSYTANQYKITYDANGGSGSPSTQTLTYDQAGNISSQTPTKAGYEFLGWATAKTATSPTYSEGQSVKNLSSSNGATIQLYAVWTPLKSNISYYTDGGTAVPSETVTGTESTTVKTTIKTGYTLQGYTTDSDSDVVEYKVGDTLDYTNLTSTFNLYAIWTPNTYTIHFADTSGGSIADVEDITATYDTDVTLPVLKNTEFNTFSGWSCAAGTFNSTAKNLTDEAGGTVVLTAQWTPIQGSIDDITNNFYQAADTAKIESQLSSIQEKLNSITTASELSSSDVKTLQELIQSLTGISSDVASQLVDIIKSSTALSESEKIQLLTDLSNGYLTESDRALLQKAIAASGLAATQREYLLQQLSNIPYLSYADQQAILSALNNGSSATYKAGDGVEYTLTKGSDGMITVALKSLNGITDLTIPNSVTLAGNTYPITGIAPGAFKGNSILRSVVIPGNVATIGASAFEGCTALQKVTTTKGLITIGNKAFKGCTALTSFSCPSTVKTIGNSAFENCTKLKTIKLNNGLLQIGNKAFYNCKALTKVVIPKSVLRIGKRAFAKCIKLKKVTFKNFSASKLATLGDGAFQGDIALTKIKLPAKLAKIQKKTFAGCTKLKTVTGMKNVTNIGVSAFEGCKKISTITLKARVQVIDEKAFFNCKALKTVTIKSKALTKVGTKAFKGCKKGITFKVPDTKKADYSKLFKGKY